MYCSSTAVTYLTSPFILLNSLVHITTTVYLLFSHKLSGKVYNAWLLELREPKARYISNRIKVLLFLKFETEKLSSPHLGFDR